MPPKKRKTQPQDENSTDEESHCKRGKPDKVESKLKYDLEWDEYGDKDSKNIRPLFYLWSKSLPGREKIAAFDIDGTIIVTKTGKTFAASKPFSLSINRFNYIFTTFKYQRCK